MLMLLKFIREVSIKKSGQYYLSAFFMFLAAVIALSNSAVLAFSPAICIASHANSVSPLHKLIASARLAIFKTSQKFVVVETR